LQALKNIFTLTLIGMSYKSKKNVYLKRHLGASFIRLNELDQAVLGLAGSKKIKPIDVNFHLHRSVETFDKKFR